MPRWPERSLKERFWEKVKVGPADECWEWTAYRNKGYGHFRISAKEGYAGAHRMAYALGNNIPFESLTPECVVMHACDNPACCNPAHLRAGTLADNNRDSWVKGRRALVHHRGAKNGNSKLTEAEVIAIRSAAGTNSEIGQRFGVTGVMVRYIRQRKNWKHVA